MRTLNTHTLRLLADLDTATTDNLQVRFSPSGSSYLVEGVARHFTDVNGNFPSEDADVRDTYLRISGMVEWFLPVADVLQMMDDGLFVVQNTRATV